MLLHGLDYVAVLHCDQRIRRIRQREWRQHRGNRAIGGVAVVTEGLHRSADVAPDHLLRGARRIGHIVFAKQAGANQTEQRRNRAARGGWCPHHIRRRPIVGAPRSPCVFVRKQAADHERSDGVQVLLGATSPMRHVFRQMDGNRLAAGIG